MSLLCWLSVLRRLVRSVDHGDAACSDDERRRCVRRRTVEMATSGNVAWPPRCRNVK